MRLAFLVTLVAAGASLAAPPPLQRKTLADGLEVLVAEDHALPLFTVEIAAKNGSMTEPPDYNGLSHLYEHMFFKANEAIPDQEAWLAKQRALGISFNGSTSTERVNYFFTTTSDHFDDTMTFMRDAIVTPLFDPKELERERVVVTGEIDRNEASPGYHFTHALEQRLWWKYPSRKDPLGSRATVLAATVDQMRTIQKRYYVPNNSVLVVTGDVKADAVFALAERLYAGWARAEDPFVKFPLVQHPPLPRTSVVVVQQPVQGAVAQLSWHGPSTVGKDVELTYAADVLANVVAEPSSRFQRDLVDSGACLGASFSWYTQANVGPITAGVEAPPEKIDDCLRGLVAELPKLKDPDYLTDDELKNAVFRASVDDMLDRERPSALAHSLTFWWTSAGLDYYFGYIDHLRAATREQMARFIDGFVLGKPYVLAVLVSPEMAKEQHLDQAHFEALVGAKPYAPPEPDQPAPSAAKKKGAK